MCLDFKIHVINLHCMHSSFQNLSYLRTYFLRLDTSMDHLEKVFYNSFVKALNV